MAGPFYSTDLVNIDDLAETVGNYDALGGGGAGLAADPDFAIQGVNSITKQVTGAGVQKGMMTDHGSAVTMGTDTHIFAWVYATCPGLIDSVANSGLTVTVGTTTSDYNDYSMEFPKKGGHFCWIVKYSTAVPNPGTQTGTPGADPQWFGGQIKVTGIIRDANLAVDACRYGTGAYMQDGDAAEPASFQQFADVRNDTISNQYGILTRVNGSLLLQGRFGIGYSAIGPASRNCWFVDSNVNIIITDTPHSNTDFTKILINGNFTQCHWTNVSITSLGTNNPGQVIFVSNIIAIGSIIGGTWTDMGISTFVSDVTATGLTWRNCALFTQGGSTITDCFLDGSSGAVGMLLDNPSLITGTDFPGGGTGHAVQCDTVGTFSWTGNTDTGYTGTRGSNATPASGSTDAMFYNDSGGLITLNVGGGGQSPSVRNGTGATTVVNATVNVTFELLHEFTEVRVFLAGTGTAVDGIEDVAITSDLDGTKYKFTWATANGTAVDYQLINNNYVIFRVEGYTVPANDVTINIAQRLDLNI